MNKYTLIFLHGMYQTNKSLEYIYETINNNFKNIKIIFPNAPIIDIDWPHYKEYNVSSWYNYYSNNNGKLYHDLISLNDFNREKNRIYKIIKNEIDLLNGKSENIIIGGISQGGTIAFDLALTCDLKLAAFIGIHTILMDDYIKKKLLNNLPIYLFSGKNDEIYDIKLQKRSVENLNLNIKWIIKDLTHCESSILETEFLIKTLNKIIK